MKKLFVIVVTYRGRQWYDRCLSSIQNSRYEATTIVVDNASGDDSVEYIMKNYPEAVIIESPENLGFGRANNLGMRYALDHDCDYVFLLNQDAWLEPDALEKMVAVAERHPDYGIIAPMHMNPDRLSLEEGFVTFMRDINNTNGDFFNDMYWGHVSDVYPTRYIHAAGWLINRDTLLTVGGFDPIFYHYEEDDDYLQRAHYHGKKVGVCPQARMVHDCKRSRPADEETSRRRHQQEILVDMVNINHPPSLQSFLNTMRRRHIKALVKCNFSLARVIKEDIRYFSSMSNRIDSSRSQNIKQHASWL